MKAGLMDEPTVLHLPAPSEVVHRLELVGHLSASGIADNVASMQYLHHISAKE